MSRTNTYQRESKRKCICGLGETTIRETIEESANRVYYGEFPEKVKTEILSTTCPNNCENIKG